VNRLTRRQLGAWAAWPWAVTPLAWSVPGTAQSATHGQGAALAQALARALARAIARARALRDAAQRDGDQPYGAVVLRGDAIVGEGPSRVVTGNDPTAHAEMEAIRDAVRRLRTRELSGCVLVSTSRPCRMCEAAAGWARIDRMVHGDALTDAGPPS
jgi:tRNA(Arg) A34 adenosine deaminase TadA